MVVGPESPAYLGEAQVLHHLVTEGLLLHDLFRLDEPLDGHHAEGKSGIVYIIYTDI